MTQARELLLGLDGPAVLVPARVAHRITPRLAAWLRELAAEGATLDPEVVEVVRALQLAASRYAAERVTAKDGSRGLPRAPQPRPLGYDWLTARQVADRLGCKVRNVADLRARGRIAGTQELGGQWRYDPVSVAEYAQERDAA